MCSVKNKSQTSVTNLSNELMTLAMTLPLFAQFISKLEIALNLQLKIIL
jgi:hypothetical protein